MKLKDFTTEELYAGALKHLTKVKGPRALAGAAASTGHEEQKIEHYAAGNIHRLMIGAYALDLRNDLKAEDIEIIDFIKYIEFAGSQGMSFDRFLRYLAKQYRNSKVS